MKELTTEMTLRITNVEKLDAANIEEYMTREKDPVYTRYFEDKLKNTLFVDDVKVVGMKHFVNDPEEEKPQVNLSQEDLDYIAEKVADKLKPTISVETFFDDKLVAEAVGSGMIMRGGH